MVADETIRRSGVTNESCTGGCCSRDGRRGALRSCAVVDDDDDDDAVEGWRDLMGVVNREDMADGREAGILCFEDSFLCHPLPLPYLTIDISDDFDDPDII